MLTQFLDLLTKKIKAGAREIAHVFVGKSPNIEAHDFKTDDRFRLPVNLFCRLSGLLPRAKLHGKALIGR